MQPSGSDSEKLRLLSKHRMYVLKYTHIVREVQEVSGEKIRFSDLSSSPSFSAPIEKLSKHANAGPQRPPAHRPFDRS